MRAVLIAVLCVRVPFSVLNAQQSSNQQKDESAKCPVDCPMHGAHSHGDSSSTPMQDRGEQGMEFSQTATTHHFFLKSDGGVIQVEVNDPKDTTNRDNIRMHLTHIA